MSSVAANEKPFLICSTSKVGFSVSENSSRSSLLSLLCFYNTLPEIFFHIAEPRRDFFNDAKPAVYNVSDQTAFVRMQSCPHVRQRCYFNPVLFTSKFSATPTLARCSARLDVLVWAGVICIYRSQAASRS